MLLQPNGPAGDRLLGHVTVRIPIYEVTEQESWEIPEWYKYLTPGDSELVSHDIPEGYHEWLLPSEGMIEWELTPENWTEEEITAKHTAKSSE